MKVLQKIKNKLNDPLTTFKWFERTIATICILMPAILWLADNDTNDWPKFRGSISNYVYMSHSYIFGMLLCTAAMLFIFNGAVYFKAEKKVGSIRTEAKWYNVILGLSLLGVILFPHVQHPVPHYIFAGIFFLGNALVIGIFHKKKDRAVSVILALLTIFTLALALPFLNILSVFWGEWLSLTVIGIHFILESRGIISFQ